MTKIALRVNNDLSLITSLNVLGGVQDNSNQNNADTLYEWDLSSEDFLNVDTVIIEAKLSGQVDYVRYPTFIGNLSVQGVANTLSTLNLGNFLSIGNIVYTYNSEIEFAELILTLTNVPTAVGLSEAAYQFFVLPSTALEINVYPNQLSFVSQWSNAFQLLINQTNASIAINTYGIGCTMPLFTQSYAASGSITMTPSAPKAATLQPILSHSGGVSQGYNLSWPSGVSNAMLLFPSGDCSEITSIDISGLQGNIFNFDNSIWPNLSQFVLSNHRARVTTDGNFDTLNNLTSVQIYNVVAASYPSGWTFPGINAPSIQIINLDGPGIVAAQTFLNSSDFELSGSTSLKQFTLESLNNALVDPPISLGTPIKVFFIKESNNIVLGDNVNTIFQTLAANASNVFDVGSTNSNVSWNNLAIPVELNGVQVVQMTGCDLTTFPSIVKINYWENTTPTTFLMDLRLGSNKLDSATVDQILVDCDNMITGVYTIVSGNITLSGQTPPAPPGPSGTAAAISLATKGLTVSTD